MIGVLGALDGEGRPVASAEPVTLDRPGLALAQRQVDRTIVVPMAGFRWVRSVGHVVHHHPDQVVPPPTEHPGRGGIREADPSRRVEPADALGGGVEDELVLAAEPGDLLFGALALDRVPDGPANGVSPDLSLDQVVLSAGVERLERRVLVVQPGDDHDRNLHELRPQGLHPLEANGIG